MQIDVEEDEGDRLRDLEGCFDDYTWWWKCYEKLG